MNPMDVANWIKLHWVEIGVAIGYVVALARIVVAWTPSPKDDTALESIVAFLRKFTLTIPPAPPTPPIPPAGAAGAAGAVRVIPVIRNISTGEIMPRRRRPLIRAALRGLAEARGLKVTDSQLDQALDDIEAEAGPVQSLIAWIVANPEVAIAILKAVLALSAEKQKAEDVSA